MTKLQFNETKTCPLPLVVLVIMGFIVSIDAIENVLNNYVPEAIDESVRYVEGSNQNLVADSGIHSELINSNDATAEDDFADILRNREDNFGENSSTKNNDKFEEVLRNREEKFAEILRNREEEESNFESSLYSGELVNGRKFGTERPNSDNKKISETLYPFPKSGSTQLTRLITGKETPTFVYDKVLQPTINTNPQKGRKVIASYNLLIPILVPAVKSSKTIINGGKTFDQDIKYTKETKTEMIPIQKQKPNVVTILKAERIPERITNDFVTGPIPTTVDDQLHSNEKLIKTVVQKIN